LNVNFLLIFLTTLVLQFNWAEYTLAFLPFVIIEIALISKKIELNRFSYPISFGMLILSFLNTKMTHTQAGIRWQWAQELVRGGLKPSDIEIGQFAWYPWWYYEEVLDKELKTVNFDKAKLPERLLGEDFDPAKPIPKYDLTK